MRTQVREVDFDEREDVLRAFLRGHLSAHRNDGHFEWMYRSNPDGPPRVWMVTEANTDRIVGVAAAFPRQVHVQGKVVTCWNLGDFAVTREHRSLGPAVELQRACLQQVMSGEIPFAYDHPSCNMTAIYRWMKIPITGRVVRYVLPLRVDDRVKAVLGDQFVSSAVSKVGNVLLETKRRSLLGRPKCAVRKLEGRFSDQVTEMEQRVAPNYPVVGARTADYLNWRYLDNPNHRYEVLVAETDGRCVGYSVFRREQTTAIVSDLYAERSDGIVESLVDGVCASIADGMVQTLSAPLLESNPFVPALSTMGFQARETASFVVCVRPGSALDGVVNEATNWFHSDGDRDV